VRGHPDRRPGAERAQPEHGPLQVEEPALEVHRPFGLPQQPDHVDALGQPRDRLVPRQAVGPDVELLARAEARADWVDVPSVRF